MLVGGARRLRSVCPQLLGVGLVGAAQVFTGDLILGMCTPCRSGHCFGLSRKLLIILSKLVLGYR